MMNGNVCTIGIPSLYLFDLNRAACSLGINTYQLYFPKVILILSHENEKTSIKMIISRKLATTIDSLLRK